MGARYDMKQITKNQLIKYMSMIVIAGIMLVQTGYGIIWAVGNLRLEQMFYESSRYLELSRILGADQWHPVLYPLFLRGVQEIGKLCHCSWQPLLSAVQTVISYIAAFFLTRSIAGETAPKVYRRVFCILSALYLITFPVMMQMNYAILPDSLAVSSILVILSNVMMLYRRKKDVRFAGKEIIAIAVFLLLLSLLYLKYLYFGLCIVIFPLLLLYRKQRKQRQADKKAGLGEVREEKQGGRSGKEPVVIQTFVLGLAVLCLSMGLAKLTVQENKEMAQYNIHTILLERFLYPNVSEDYVFYSQEIKDALGEEFMAEHFDHRAELLSRLGAYIENRVGQEESGRIYQLLIQESFRRRTRQIVSEIIQDIAWHLAEPVYFVKMWKRTELSAVPWNYGRMAYRNPVLTERYMEVAGRNLIIAVLLCILWCGYGAALEIKSKRMERLKSKGIGLVFAGIMGGCISTIMTLMSVHCADYRSGLLFILLWEIAVAVVLAKMADL